MDKNIELFCQNLANETGISFPPSRYTFILNRLSPLLEKYNCRDLSDLIRIGKNNFELKMAITNVLTTNETWFFRHPEQFEILKTYVLPELIKRKSDKTLSIWSAGCSIGAELYSILITVLEAMPSSANYRLNLLGSDISYDAITNARKGIYDSRELRATDRTILEKYFHQLSSNTYQVKDELKAKVNFEYLNLMGNWPPRTFDIILCRNTMIYFNESSKKNLITRLFKALNINGYFFTSANEQVYINEGNFSIKKLFINNEVVYKKLNQISKSWELFFKTPSDLLKTINFLRKNSYTFNYGQATAGTKGSQIRSLIISDADYDTIIKNLAFNSIELLKTVCIKS